MEIRESLASELPHLRALHERAFGEREGPVVAQLVSDLLADPSALPLLSLTALEEGEITGHILFSHARLTNGGGEMDVAILAPLAVAPGHQRSGIGGLLIEAGCRALAHAGISLIFLAGHPSYYPRHGFEPAHPLGFIPPYPFPEEMKDGWMVRRIDEDQEWPAGGDVSCAAALDREDLWRE